MIGLDDQALAEALIADKGYWMDAETASNEFACIPYRHHKMPEDFRHALIANYGSRADLERERGRRVEYFWEKVIRAPRETRSRLLSASKCSALASF